MSRTSWTSILDGRIPPELDEEIRIFETELARRRTGELDEKVFAETRLRRGVYGQRYDNGTRHDGTQTRDIQYPAGEVLKGPDTLWDAPDRHAADQDPLRTPDRRPDGDPGRCCRGSLDRDPARDHPAGHPAPLHPHRGHSRSHAPSRLGRFDHARSLRQRGAKRHRLPGGRGLRHRVVRRHSLCGCSGRFRPRTPGHPGLRAEVQDRLFRLPRAGLRARLHARPRPHRPRPERERRAPGAGIRGLRGRRARSGSPSGGPVRRVPPRGRGPAPGPGHRPRFCPARGEEEPRPGPDQVPRGPSGPGGVSRARARGAGRPPPRSPVDLVPRRSPRHRRTAASAPESRDDLSRPARGILRWHRTNVAPQKQPGYAGATVTLPLGDLTAKQMRGLARLARERVGDTIRATVEQNLLLRWVPEAELPELYRGLAALGLGQPGAGTLVDITSCPGTDTCKLGIASSRGLAETLRQRILRHDIASDDAIQDLRIKISGCFNSCGQHHVADIGFYGVSRKIGGRTVPHFQLVIGGQWRENARSFGLAIGALPAKRIPEALSRLTDLYREEREPGEQFRAFVARVGKTRIKSLVQDLADVADFARTPELYSDWGDPRVFTLGDMGKGECAGEVVSQTDFGLAASERQVFEAQVRLDRGEPADAVALAYRAMVRAARTLVRTRHLDVSERPAEVVSEFRARFVDTKLFHDPYAGGKFAQYLFRAHEHAGEPVNGEARQRIEEAQLFIEAAYACHARLPDAPGGGTP